MKKVAIVGVEGSGKTVMLAGLGELYSRPDENGYFLAPKNFATASYVATKISRMRKGVWPTATAEDVLQGLDWTLRRKNGSGGRPEDVCEISCLDFAGEVYRLAFGIKSESGGVTSDEVKSLKAYVRDADEIIVLINLRDVIEKGDADPRVQEAKWITNAILAFALDTSGGRREPRATIVLSQADSYASTISAYGGARGVLEKFLPHVANNYDWLDVFEASAVDRTVVDDEGNFVPAPDFHPTGLKPIVDWIKRGNVSAGEVPEVRNPAESEEVAEWRRSAKRGDADAQFNLGWSYVNGTGVNKNVSTGIKWLRKAADQGHSVAQNNLGWCHQNGVGVNKDMGEAVRWYYLAAGQGLAIAQNNLGWCYENGVGVEANMPAAIDCYHKAAEQGDANAAAALKRLSGAGATQPQQKSGGALDALFGGRCNRAGLWKGALLFGAVVFGMVQLFPEEEPPVWAIVVLVGGALMFLRLVILRLHDFGLSGWFILSPLVVLCFPESWRVWILILLLAGPFFEEGEATSNKYGPPPA